jgi:hypothetical protein
VSSCSFSRADVDAFASTGSVLYTCIWSALARTRTHRFICPFTYRPQNKSPSVSILTVQLLLHGSVHTFSLRPSTKILSLRNCLIPFFSNVSRISGTCQAQPQLLPITFPYTNYSPVNLSRFCKIYWKDRKRKDPGHLCATSG